MASGIKPWTRQLALCNSWLEIIADELALRGHELEVTEANQLAEEAAAIQVRADGLALSLRNIAKGE
jgi:hypothetical protein